MSAPLFSNIPPELICQVFELLDSFSSVAALARTGRKFYQTWRTHATPICRAVGPRCFTNFNEAERLVDMQSQAENASPSQESSELKSIIRAKRLLSNARCAAAACADWVNFCQIQHSGWAEDRGPEGSPETYMRPSECALFEQNFYILWTLGVMQSAPHLQHHAAAYLEKCTAKELCRLDEMSEWMHCYNENEFGDTGLDLRDKVWMAGYKVVGDYYGKYMKDKGVYRPSARYTPIGFFAFFDHTQRYLDQYEDR
jgi:hypothetical protein